MSYNKYKDAPPENSIQLAHSIFRILGIDPEIEVSKRVDGIFSAVLTDKAAQWITCGKGTSEAFCVASACGEAIEHLCNYTAYDMSRVSAQANEMFGFSQYPDEVSVSISEILSVFPQIYADLQQSYGLLTGKIAAKKDIVELLNKLFQSDVIPCIPFYSVKQRRKVLIPNVLLSNLCGSNGGGAGNTPEEAIGHALDEIAERYAKERIYHAGLTPPNVPFSFIEARAPELLTVIQKIEKLGNYEVTVKDASLGCGLPVLCVLLVDREHQKYMVNFGAHPCFPIALERCLTEMFQFYEAGKTGTRRKKMAPLVMPIPEILNGIGNWVSLLKDDVGYVPFSFFVGAPSWSFADWPKHPDYTNALGLRQQLGTLQMMSDDIYIRSNSYFSFFAYRVYIPGISTTKLPFDEKQLESYQLSGHLTEMLNQDEELSSTERKRLRELVFSPNTFAGALVLHNMEEELRYALYAALIKDSGEGDYAVDILKMMDSKRCRCAIRAIELSADGMPKKDIQELLRLFYSPEDCAFGLAWLETSTFDHLTDLYIRHPRRTQKAVPPNAKNDSVNLLHQRLKKYMREHPIDQLEIDNVLYSNQE